MKKYIILAIIIASAALYFVGGISSRRDADRLTHALAIANGEKLGLIESYEVEINGLKRVVYEANQIILTKNEAIRTGYIEKERYRKLYLKEISHVADLNLTISVLNDSIEKLGQVVTVPDPVSGDPVPSLVLPFHFDKTNKWLTLTGDINTIGRMSFSLEMPVDLDLTIGMQKRTKEPVISAMTNNPYITQVNISSVQITKPDRWYNSTWFKVGAGFAGGVAFYHYVK